MTAPVKSISEARAKGLMLFTAYQGLWFTPDELEAKNADGNFLWGDDNWQLRPVSDYLSVHLRKLERAQIEYDNALARVAGMRKE